MQKISFVIAALAALALTGPATASDEDKDCISSPLANWMSADVASKKAQSTGMNTHNIYVVGSYFEIHGQDKNGIHVRVYVNPVNGNIVGTRASSGRFEIRSQPVCVKIVPLPTAWVSADDIYKVAQGLNMDVRGINVVGSYYEVHAIDKNNQRILAYFSPLNGKLVSTRGFKHPIRPRAKPVRVQGLS